MSDGAKRVLRQWATSAGVVVLLLALYGCSIVPARIVVHWLDHWRMIPYTPVNNALNTCYAPVLWMDDHVPIITDAGEIVDRKTKPLYP